MNASEIDNLLRLHRAAYEVLLWINKRAETNRELLSKDNLQIWRFANSCEQWLCKAGGTFPQALRPAPQDVPVLANLFSSFFQTSFRLAPDVPVACRDDWGEPAWQRIGRRRLVAGQPSRSKAGKAKTNRAMLELCVLALQELTAESHPNISPSSLEFLAVSREFSQDTLLWTYFRELQRRSQFASQGAAVHRIWQSLDEKIRENLDSSKILNARASLLKGLEALISRTATFPN